MGFEQMRWAVALVLVTCTVLLLASNLRARDMPRRLRILVPSDMHDDLASVNRLKSAVADVDLVICPGDLTTMPNLRLDSSAAELRTYEERSTRVHGYVWQASQPATLVFVSVPTGPPWIHTDRSIDTYINRQTVR